MVLIIEIILFYPILLFGNFDHMFVFLPPMGSLYLTKSRSWMILYNTFQIDKRDRKPSEKNIVLMMALIIEMV